LLRNLSTWAAIFLPLAMARTTREAPLAASPATNTFSPNEDYTEAIKNEQIEPGVNLAKDISNIPGKVGDYVKFFKAFKVYPVLELRLSRRISF